MSKNTSSSEPPISNPAFLSSLNDFLGRSPANYDSKTDGVLLEQLDSAVFLDCQEDQNLSTNQSSEGSVISMRKAAVNQLYKLCICNELDDLDANYLYVLFKVLRKLLREDLFHKELVG